MSKFCDIASMALTTRKKTYEYKNERSFEAWGRAVDMYLNPALGDKDITEIKRGDVLKVLDPIWREKTATANLVRQVAKYVFSYAIYLEEFKGANPASWDDGLQFALPSPEQVHVVVHREAPSIGEICRVIPELAASEHLGARCVAFGMLTALRATEFRALKWSEVNMDTLTISIPPARRKDKKKEPFIVPLSRQAATLLRNLPRNSEFVFPGRKGKKPITGPALLYSIRQFLPSHKGVTMHGCRSTFSGWCAETGKDSDLREACLMHAVGSKVSQDYMRSELIEQRRTIMQSWADAIFHD